MHHAMYLMFVGPYLSLLMGHSAHNLLLQVANKSAPVQTVYPNDTLVCPEDIKLQESIPTEDFFSTSISTVSAYLVGVFVGDIAFTVILILLLSLPTLLDKSAHVHRMAAKRIGPGTRTRSSRKEILLNGMKKSNGSGVLFESANLSVEEYLDAHGHAGYGNEHQHVSRSTDQLDASGLRSASINSLVIADEAPNDLESAYDENAGAYDDPISNGGIGQEEFGMCYSKGLREPLMPNASGMGLEEDEERGSGRKDLPRGQSSANMSTTSTHASKVTDIFEVDFESEDSSADSPSRSVLWMILATGLFVAGTVLLVIGIASLFGNSIVGVALEQLDLESTGKTFRYILLTGIVIVGLVDGAIVLMHFVVEPEHWGLGKYKYVGFNISSFRLLKSRSRSYQIS